MGPMHRHVDGSSRQGAVRRLIAMVAAMVVALMTIAAMPTHASAAPNTAIRVDQISLGGGSGPGGQLIVGDTVGVAGTWDASEANPKPGDSFRIGLPPELGFDTGVIFSLTGLTGDGEDVTWATCVSDPAADDLICTLTDIVADYPEQVRGEFQFEAGVEQTTTEVEIVFDLNGIDTPVRVPGEGGIGDGVILPDEWSKTGAMNANNWSMAWQIDLPGSNLQGRESITIQDTLSANHVLCEPANLRVQTVRGDSTSAFTGAVELTPSESPQVFTIDLEAPDAGFDSSVIYRITYDTCTPDRQIDPANTEYSNEAYIAAWNSSSGVIGVTNRPWHGTISKSGSVLGGASRNGTIAWTVTVPGDALVGHDSLTLTEVLGAGHEVGPDTISTIAITERYGPSSQRDRVVTDRFTSTVLTSGADSFTVRFDISSDDFAFKPSDHRYVITYRTYVSQEGLPAAGTSYSNAVDVNGSVTTGSTRVPSRSQGKSGQLNGSVVSIDGVDHPPQTTMNWTVRIPGELLTDVEGDLTLTDTLTASHDICIAGDPAGDLADRLNLAVTARDQISNGGLATVNLTASTQVRQEGRDIIMTIPAPELPLPGGGTATGFSEEYQYLLTYTTCTASGGMDAPGTEYGNAIVGTGVSFSQSITQWNRGSGSGTGVARGSVVISKDLDMTAPGADFVPEGTSFTVRVSEIDPTGTPQATYDLAVPLGGDPVAGLNARGRGWTAVLSEPTFPSVPGVAFGDPVFSGGENVAVSADGRTATVDLTPGENVEVTVTNSTRLGSLTLEKDVDVLDESIVLPARTYDVIAHIDTSALGTHVPVQADRTVTLTPGESITINGLPIGAIVTFSETGLVDDDILTWLPPVFSPARVVVGAETVSIPTEVLVTNSVERTVGSLSVVKTVTGEQADNPAIPETVTVEASWNEEGVPGSTVLAVPTDGTPVPLGVDLLIGTRVRLVEVPLEDGSSITWGTPTWSSGGYSTEGASFTVPVRRDGDATVTIENRADTSTATVELMKSVTGDAAGDVGSDVEFPVTATWTDGDGEQSRDLLINAVEPTPLGVDLPAGTVVTITEGERPGIDTVDWGGITISGDGVSDLGDGVARVTISDQQDDVRAVTVTNEANWAPSTFSLTKALADTAGADFVPEGTTFTVHVAEYDPDGILGSEYDLEVPLGGGPVTASNSFGPGWTAVLTESTFPEVPGVVFGDPVFGPTDGVTVSEDGMTATVAYMPGQDVALVLTNTPELGSIALTKEIVGGAADVVEEDRTFEVTVTIDTTGLGADVPEQADRTVELITGEQTIIDDLPIGAVVTVTESPLDDDILTWGNPVIEPGVLTVEAVDTPAGVTVTNSVERTVGTFSISKTVTGEQADNPAVPESVTVLASWDEEGVPGSVELTVPTDGTSVPLGVDLLIGTEVRLTEVLLEDHSGIAWSTPIWSGDSVEIDGLDALVSVTRDADASVSLENHAAVSVAGISILKAIAGPAADEVAPETEFPVTATWTVDGEEQSRELLINAVEPTPLGVDLPAGTVVTLTEGERPGFDTVIWDSIVIGGTHVTDGGDGTAEVVVSDLQGDVMLVTVTNEATWAPGTFTLAKQISGVLLDNPDVPDTVRVTASWMGEGAEPASRTIDLPTDGTPIAFGEDLPHGTEVTLTEEAIAGGPAFTWTTPAWTAVDGLAVQGDGSATLTISAAQDPTVTLTNSAAASLGSLTLVKVLSGDGAEDVPADTVFPVTAQWTDLLGNEKFAEVELIAGQPVVIDGIPLGTEVVLTEGDADIPVRWTGAQWSADSSAVDLESEGRVATIVVTGTAGAEVSMTLDNTFDAEPVGNLPWTGADVRVMFGAALLLVAAGVYLLRRRSA